MPNLLGIPAEHSNIILQKRQSGSLVMKARVQVFRWDVGTS